MTAWITALADAFVGAFTTIGNGVATAIVNIVGTLMGSSDAPSAFLTLCLFFLGVAVIMSIVWLVFGVFTTRTGTY